MNELTKTAEESQKEKIIPEFIGDLPRRNTLKYALIKAILKYLLLLTISFASGMLFCMATGDKLLEDPDIYKSVARHFTDVFNGCSSFQSYASVTISSSSADIRYLILIFTSGFTYFSALANSALILCKGFTLGFSLEYLLSSIKATPSFLSEPYKAVTLFILSEFALSAFMVFLSAKTLIFAYDFRRIRGRKSKIIRSPVIYHYILLYLTGFGLILMINLISCLISMLIYR